MAKMGRPKSDVIKDKIVCQSSRGQSGPKSKPNGEGDGRNG